MIEGIRKNKEGKNFFVTKQNQISVMLWLSEGAFIFISIICIKITAIHCIQLTSVILPFRDFHLAFTHYHTMQLQVPCPSRGSPSLRFFNDEVGNVFENPLSYKYIEYIPNTSTSTVMSSQDNGMEVPESAINYDAAVGTWLPHTKGHHVACKLWRILPCNFRFFLNGRIMVGPGRPFWIYLVCLLIGVNISYIVFDVLPFYNSLMDSIIGLILTFLSCTALYNLLRVVFTDPGYMLPHWFSNQRSWLTKTKTLDEVHEKYGYTSYCNICKIFQFPDTYHCNDCHACIDGGDHHCLLLGTCVGKRNYRFFYIFTITANAAFWMGMIMSITHLVQNWIANGALFAFARAITLYLILSTIILPPLGMYVMLMLPIVHTKLIYQGITLNQEEFFPTLWELRDLTFTEKIQRFFRNFHNKIIRTTPPSQIPYRVLQLTVRMPAVARTQVVDSHHDNLQIQCSQPRLKLVMKTLFTEPRYLSFRLAHIHRDLDIFGYLSTPIESLERDQKDIKAMQKFIPTRIRTRGKGSVPAFTSPPPPKSQSNRRSFISFCLNCSRNCVVHPAGKYQEIPKVGKGDTENEIMTREISDIV